jgi:hypothetical protein
MNHSSHVKLILAAAAVFGVLAAFGVPVLSNLPLLGIVLICPLMMVFMMRTMNHGASRDDESDHTKNSAHQH